MDMELQKIVEFILEIEKLKTIKRKDTISDISRNESSAEHSWHISTMAIFIHDYVAPKTNLLKVLKLLLIHDIVEIYTGDVFGFDIKRRKLQSKKEDEAIFKICKLLPNQYSSELLNLWKEFVEAKTQESKFAIALDKISPIFQNISTQGKTWKENNISLDQIEEYHKPSAEYNKKFLKLYKMLISEVSDKKLSKDN